MTKGRCLPAIRGDAGVSGNLTYPAPRPAGCSWKAGSEETKGVIGGYAVSRRPSYYSSIMCL